MAISIREARPGDGTAMGRISRESFEAPMRDYLVSTQPRIGLYWDVVLEHPTSFPGREFRIAEEGNELLGLAEFRIEGSRSLLSHVCVVDGARRRGVASLLIRDHLDHHPGVVRMDLDVFDDNVGAKRLYARLGFVATSATAWLRCRTSVADTSPRQRLAFDDMHTSVAWFETFGFCSLSGRLGGTAFRAGRIGSDLLRLYGPETVSDTALVADLSLAFPTAREVISVLPVDEVPPGALLAPFMSATRMTAPDVRKTVPR